ncbi:MAG: hypothetical protein KZQ59_02565, partial [Candidatus Thiodiazotropha sp. (ex Lucinoma aequizonata)]|nr:hypothetical protein [Candidatus Thiodiazotropha sp. (ex Lucinoma aequizonata)]
AGKNSACIDNEARYNQARQYGFSEKMSFLPGTILMNMVYLILNYRPARIAIYGFEFAHRRRSCLLMNH